MGNKNLFFLFVALFFFPFALFQYFFLVILGRFARWNVSSGSLLLDSAWFIVIGWMVLKFYILLYLAFFMQISK